MTAPASNPADHKTAVEIALLRSEVTRIANVVERVIQDHESRLRNLEQIQLAQGGVLRLIGWLGAPTAAAMLYFVARGA